ncbi:DUF4238 domain-containing protein [Xanthobacter autotrophicus]|uniref:DUF4238 domain-containing protein n=1 Tax=Xanthobacter autotrophicus TaxID=280 RepID=UPI0037299526
MTQGHPNRHHYIPVFYLKRWAGSDRRVCQFSEHMGEIVPNRRSPKATGFVDGLYKIEGLPEHLNQQVEKKFFQPADSMAAKALSMMESYGDNTKWDNKLRSAWTLFLISLLLRCPEDIDIFSKWWGGEFIQTDRESEQEYQKRRRDSDPVNFREYLTNRPISEIEITKFRILSNLIGTQEIGQTINNFNWHVVCFPPNCVPLMTSDRPIIRTNGLMRPNGHLAIPIGPKRLFVATPDNNMSKYLQQAPLTQIAKEINQHVVRSAMRFSYAEDDKHLKFVAKNFGKLRQPRLINSIIKENESIVPPINVG